MDQKLAKALRGAATEVVTEYPQLTTTVEALLAATDSGADAIMSEVTGRLRAAFAELTLASAAYAAQRNVDQDCALFLMTTIGEEMIAVGRRWGYMIRSTAEAEHVQDKQAPTTDKPPSGFAGMFN